MLRPLTKVFSGFGRRFSAVVSDKSDLIVTHLQDDDAGIIVLSLNRPNIKNAFNESLISNLLQRLDEVQSDKKCRVVILRSNVRGVFSSGADLKERIGVSLANVNHYASRLRLLTNCLHNLPLPVITAVDGFALGGGLELVIASDLIVASENVKMGLIETKLAIIPGAGGTQRLPRLVGKSLAKELIFTGRTFSGLEAYKMGLVNKCVKQNENGDAAYIEALNLAREILPNGPIGVRVAKEAINRGSEVDIATGCSIEELCFYQVLISEDRLEGLNAFTEKRPPRYLGK